MVLAMKARKGFSLIEVIASVVLMSMLLIVMTRLTLAEASNSMIRDEQVDVMNADGWIGDIYDDFHNALTFEYGRVVTPGVSTAESPIELRFTYLDGTYNVYRYDPITRSFYTNGVYQFTGQSFVVSADTLRLTLSVQISDKRKLNVSIYK